MARNLFDKVLATESLQVLVVQPRVLNVKDFELVDWSRETVVLCVFSTTGDGRCGRGGCRVS